MAWDAVLLMAAVVIKTAVVVDAIAGESGEWWRRRWEWVVGERNERRARVRMLLAVMEGWVETCRELAVYAQPGVAGVQK